MAVSWISWILVVVGAVQVCQGDVFVSSGGETAVLLGESARIECGVEDSSGETIHWMFVSGAGNAEATPQLIAFDSNVMTWKSIIDIEAKTEDGVVYRNLNIHEAGLEQEGVYICGAGDYTQRTQLNVYVPPTLDPIPQLYELSMGESIEVTCNAQGKPQPTITWGRLTPITDFPESVTYDGDSLWFTASTPYDAGQYECTAQNGAGVPVTQTTDIRIYYAPNVTVEEELLHTAPGEDLSIRCSFLARPEVEVKWFHDGEEVTNESAERNIAFGEERKEYEDSFTLRIDGLEEEDLGTYQCVGRNDYGEARGEIELFAHPHRFEILSAPNGLYSNVYKLEWTVESLPQLSHYDLQVEQVNDTVRTLIANHTLPGSDLAGFAHQLMDLIPNTTYIVHFRANNNYGSTEWLKFEFLTADEGNTYTNPPPTTVPPPTTPRRHTVPNSKDVAGSESTSSGHQVFASLVTMVTVCVVAMVL